MLITCGQGKLTILCNQNYWRYQELWYMIVSLSHRYFSSFNRATFDRQKQSIITIKCINVRHHRRTPVRLWILMLESPDGQKCRSLQFLKYDFSLCSLSLSLSCNSPFIFRLLSLVINVRFRSILYSAYIFLNNLFQPILYCAWFYIEANFLPVYENSGILK